MANIRTIQAAALRLTEQLGAARDAKEEKENPTERDEEQAAALEECLEAVEAAIEELLAAYE